ncbi:MAG: hypothetical protein ACRERD_13280, partial [Candidatus Binatia bacterium]
MPYIVKGKGIVGQPDPKHPIRLVHTGEVFAESLTPQQLANLADRVTWVDTAEARAGVQGQGSGPALVTAETPEPVRRIEPADRPNFPAAAVGALKPEET